MEVQLNTEQPCPETTRKFKDVLYAKSTVETNCAVRPWRVRMSSRLRGASPSKWVARSALSCRSEESG